MSPRPLSMIDTAIATFLVILQAVAFASAQAASPVLVDFQVAQPPPLPADARQCTIELFQYVLFIQLRQIFYL